MTQQSVQLPSPPQVVELLTEEFAAVGYEIDEVLVAATAKPPRITVVADGDRPLDLDAVAELSRRASARLDDALPEATAPYVLEVSSPGVDRPLTQPKHFRRAQGRRAELTLSGGQLVTGRIGRLDGDTLEVVVRAAKALQVRPVALGEIDKAVVQVEFSPPNPRELELAGVRGEQDETEAAE